MADSIPQLKSDINALQKKLAEANRRIAELEAIPPQVITEKVPFETVKIEYRDRVVEKVVNKVVEVDKPVEKIIRVDNPAHMVEIERLNQELVKLRSMLNTERNKPAKVKEVIKEVIKPVPMPQEVRVEYRERIVEVPVEKIVNVDVPVDRIVYVDKPVEVPVIDPAEKKRADALASELVSAKAEILDLKSKLSVEKKKKPKEQEAKQVKIKVQMPAEVKIEYRDREVKVPVEKIVYVDREVVKTERVDNPALRAEIDRLNRELDDMRRTLDLERQKPPVIETVNVEVEKPVSLPPQLIIKRVEVPVVKIEYRDNPDHIETIRALQAKLKGNS